MRLQNMPTTCKKFDDQRHINSTNNWKIPKAVKKIDMRFLQIYITYCSIREDFFNINFTTFYVELNPS